MKTFAINTILCSLALNYANNTLAKNYYILVGGGDYPDNSQISIYYNTKWIYELLKKNNPEEHIYVLYTDGDKQINDVIKFSLKDEEQTVFDRLSRIESDPSGNITEYIPTFISTEEKSANIENIKSAFLEISKLTKKGDTITFVYQGHGGLDENLFNNYLKLWKGDKFRVSDFKALISQIDDEVNFRFILPQCFSGTFAQTVFRDLDSRNGIEQKNQCGFLAQRKSLESEGCTPSINSSEYQDYSFHFFSAIDGYRIDGTPVESSADRNSNGVISLEEAHIYTVKNAMSIDYSFTTSEHYLANWLPWYLKWMPIPEGDGKYLEISQYIASRFRLLDESNSIDYKKAKNMLFYSKEELDELNAQISRLKSTIISAQTILKKDIYTQWPEARLFYSEQAFNLIMQKQDEISSFIDSHPRYKDLETFQNSMVSLENSALDLQRKIVQINKIFYFKKLAGIRKIFDKYATDTQLEEYRNLLNCESSVL